MPYEDLRAFLRALEQRGLFRWIVKEVDKDWELCTVARMLFRGLPENKRFAVGFSNIKGYPGSRVVVGVTAASTEVIAAALETEPEPMKILSKVRQGTAAPLTPRTVASGPCKEVIVKGQDVDLYRFPIPIWIPGKDPGPFLTPLYVTKDPETEIHNIGMYRAQIKGKDKTGILTTRQQHGAIHIAKWESMGKPAPAAMVMGTDPTIYYAGITKYAYGADEYAIAGGMRGEPINLVKCETVDILVPATTEIVIEGEFLPGDKEDEGPFGEYTGYLSRSREPMPVFRVKCITHRREPILQGVISQFPPSESSLMKRTLHEASLMKHLKDDLGIPGIIDIHGPESTGSIAMTWIRMKKMYPGHVEQVAGATFAYFVFYPKWIIVTDEDVNIRDPFAREWALSFRVRPGRDIHVVPHSAQLGLDPSAEPPPGAESERDTSRLLIDATKKWKYEEVSFPERKYVDMVLAKWSEYGLPRLEEVQIPVEEISR